MAKNWGRLAGEKGKRVDTSRLGRAMKLGKLATRFTGSMVKAQIKKAAGRGGEEDDSLATAAMKNARHIVDVMGEMKGAAMKIGQMISADPDLVTPEFADQLARLQRSAPPMEFTTVKAQIERNLDRPLSDLFRFFDPNPLGAASIGQVHRATLFDGREVAVKVQYPGIKASLDSDMKNLGSLLKIGRVFLTKARAEAFMQESREAILMEADYTREADNLAWFREAFADQPQIRIPEPIMALTTSEVLVMEFIEGKKLDDALMAIEDQDRRDEIVTRFVAAFVFMFHDLKRLHADPHPGNFMLDADDNIVLLDFGCARSFRPALADGILRMLVAFWNDDMGALKALFTEFKFGKEDVKMPSDEVLREYHGMILAPLAHQGPFNFSKWQIHSRLRGFLRHNMEMIRLVPPAELLLYLRVLGGVKGMLTRVDANVDVRALAEACCVRHGIPLE